MTNCPSNAPGAVAPVVVDPATAATPAMASALSCRGLLAAAAAVAAATGVPARHSTLVAPLA